ITAEAWLMPGRKLSSKSSACAAVPLTSAANIGLPVPPVTDKAVPPALNSAKALATLFVLSSPRPATMQANVSNMASHASFRASMLIIGFAQAEAIASATAISSRCMTLPLKSIKNEFQETPELVPVQLPPSNIGIHAMHNHHVERGQYDTEVTARTEACIAAFRCNHPGEEDAVTLQPPHIAIGPAGTGMRIRHHTLLRPAFR